MRSKLPLIALAPLTFGLAACGDSDNIDERLTDRTGEMPTPGDVELPNIPVEYPEVAVNARETVDYAGTYRQETPDGSQRTITLNDDDTYTMRDEAGVETSGTFNWYSDNSRILIREDGETQVYAIADGAIYRMADENAPTTGPMDEEQAFIRVVAPTGSAEAQPAAE